MPIKIIMPRRSADYVSLGLIELTKQIDEKAKKLPPSIFGLGGEFGYGIDFENDTFKMERFCWCEKEDCPLCNGKQPNFVHKKTGFNIRWYKYIGRGMEHKKISSKKWKDILIDCIKSLEKK